MNIFEIFNTNAKVRFQREGKNETFGFFDLGDKKFCIHFEILDSNKITFDGELESLKQKKIVSILFGYVENDRINIFATGLNRKHFSILGSVRNAIHEWVSSNSPDMIIFSAKNNDDSYETRASLYSTIANAEAKASKLSLLKMEDVNGTYFVLTSLDLSQRQKIEIKREILGKLTLSDKVKWIKN